MKVKPGKLGKGSTDKGLKGLGVVLTVSAAVLVPIYTPSNN